MDTNFQFVCLATPVLFRGGVPLPHLMTVQLKNLSTISIARNCDHVEDEAIIMES